MKHALRKLTLLVVTLLPWLTSRGETAAVRLTFSPEEFSRREISEGVSVIEPVDAPLLRMADYDTPDLPWIKTTIDIPEGNEYQDYTLSVTESLWDSGLVIVPRLHPVPISEISEQRVFEASMADYPASVYPEERVQVSRPYVHRGVGKLDILVSPFRYDAASGDLYLATAMDIRVNHRPSGAPRALKARSASDTAGDRVIASLVPYSDGVNLDYAIITVDSLTNAFHPLLDWKRHKGLNAVMITLEQIQSAYSEGTPQLKIKKCLRHLHESRELQFVLLGGDSRLIPVQLCHNECYLETGLTDVRGIASDLFYTVFDGAFDWDANGDGVLGDIEDDIYFTSSISIGRFPVFSKETADIMVHKTICYENYLYDAWNNCMLMIATRMHSNNNYDESSVKYRTDGHFLAKRLAEYHLSSSWNGEYEYMTDGYVSSMNKYGHTFITGDLMKNILTIPHSFATVYTHGSKTEFGYDHMNKSFSLEEARILVNKFPSLISSVSCYTNNFNFGEIDDSGSSKIVGGYDKIPPKTEYFLGQGFLCNVNYGATHYIGNTHYGLGCKNYGMEGSSDIVNAEIWKGIVTNDYKTRSIGKILSEVKEYYSPYLSLNNGYCFVQYSLNLSGDPETPIFVQAPARLSKLTVADHHNGYYAINPSGISNFTIKLGHLNEKGIYEFEEIPESKTKMYKITDSHFALSIVKDGYLPYTLFQQANTLRVDDTVYIQNQVCSGDMKIIAPKVKIGADVYYYNPEGDVEFSDGTVSITAEEVILAPGTYFDLGTEVKINL